MNVWEVLRIVGCIPLVFAVYVMLSFVFPLPQPPMMRR